MRPLLSFCGMFCNEAKTVRATLRSVKPIDRWCVLDTGSTDDTAEIVEGVLGDTTGQLHRGEFVDYSTTRNLVLDLHGQLNTPAVFTLMMSADEILEGGDVLRAFLEAHRDAPESAYCVTMVNGPQQWPYTRVLRTDAKWRYEGIIHERPVGPNGEVDAPLIPGVRIVFAESDLERKKKRLRERDLPLLTRVVEDESKSYDDRARAMYYLGETHAMLAAETQKVDGKHDMKSAWLTHNMQAMSFFWRYSLIAEDPSHAAADKAKAMRGYFLYYHIADKIGFYAPTELAVRLEILTKNAPRLAEAHYLLADVAARIDVRQGLFHALHAAKVAAKIAADPPTHEAIDTRVEWLSLRLAAACAKQSKSHAQARELAERGIAAGGPKEAFDGLL